MAITYGRQLGRLSTWQRSDGGPASSRLLQELARATNAAKSRYASRNLVNDGWVSALRVTGTTESLLAMYPALPVIPYCFSLRWQVRARVQGGAGPTGTVVLRAQDAVHRGETTTGISSTLTTTSTSYGFSSIGTLSAVSLVASGAWWRDVFLSLRANTNQAGASIEVSNLAIWYEGLDASDW